MRIGTLVKNIEFDYIGIVVENRGSWWLIKWIDHKRDNWYNDCELEIVCE